VIGRPTATSLHWIEVTAKGHCGDSGDLVCTVRILGLDIVNITDVR
jgi:hypothetical protein